jgi:hypothetical protein
MSSQYDNIKIMASICPEILQTGQLRNDFILIKGGILKLVPFIVHLRHFYIRPDAYDITADERFTSFSVARSLISITR